MTQPDVVAAAVLLGQVVVPTVDVAPSAPKVIVPEKPLVRVTGCPASFSSWKVPIQGLAKLFDAVVTLEFCATDTGPVSLTAPTKVSPEGQEVDGQVRPGHETSRPVSSALILES